jgi:HK97 family phage portal protein
VSYIKRVSEVLQKSFNLDGDSSAIFEAFGDYWGINTNPNSSSVVESCANTMGNCYATAKFRLYKKVSDELRETYEHPFLDLMEYPNNFQTWWESMYFIALNQAFMGNSYWLKRRDGLGVWREIQPLPAKSIKPISSETQFIAYYELNDTQKIDPKEIIHIRYPYLGSQIEGSPLVSTILDQVTIDKLQTDLQKRFYQNSGFMGQAWSTTQTMEKNSFERAKKQLEARAGTENAFKFGLFDSGLSPVKHPYSIKDMDVAEQRKLTMEEVLRAFRMPKIMIGGTLDNVSRANAEAALYTYATTFIDPMLSYIDEVLTRHIRMEFGDKWILKHDKISPKDIETMLKYYDTMINLGAMTKNEIRIEEDFEKFPYELANVPMINVGGALVRLDTGEQLGQVPNNV